MDVNERALAEGIAGIGGMPVLWHVRARPLESISRINGSQVYAAVRSAAAEIVVPVRGVQRVATLEIHHQRNVSELALAVRRV